MKHLLTAVAGAALWLATGGAQAALTVYTTQASFLGATTSAGTDTFTGLSVDSLTASPLTRNAGTWSYTATAAGGFFGAGTAANPALSTNTDVDSITFRSFSGGVSALGALFYTSDVNGAFTPGSITITATDVLGATSTQTVSGASSFIGFVSTSSLSMVVVASVPVTGSNLWPTVDNLTLAVAAVPEPETLALMLAGVGIVGVLARRRRSR